MVSNSGIGGLTHLTGISIMVGNNLRPGEWIEFESASFPAYIKGHDSSVQPLDATPRKVALRGFDGSGNVVLIENNTDTFAGRRRLRDHSHRRLSTGTVQWNYEHKTVVIRIEGTPDCVGNRPWDPCGGVGGDIP